MDIKEVKNELRQLVADGDNHKAIDRLLDLCKSHVFVDSDKIYLLSSDYSTFQDDITYGTITQEQKNVRNSNLTKRLMYIINELEVEEKTEEPIVSALPQEGLPIDYLNEQKTDDEQTSQQTEETIIEGDRKRTTRLRLYYFSGLILVVCLSYFVIKMLSQPSIDDWVGEWQQHLQVDDSALEGVLVFEKAGTKLKGITKNIHANGNNSESVLSDIGFDPKTGNIYGHWEIPKISLSGKFEFNWVETRDSFAGFYTLDPANSEKLFWNGKKK